MLQVGINAYMSLEEANTLIGDNLLDSDSEYVLWNSLSDSNKEKLIIKGTRLVDRLPFRGYKHGNVFDAESLHWPRVIDWGIIECPKDVKLGLLKQVLRAQSNSDKQEVKLAELGIKSYSIKGASITLSDKSTAKISNGLYQDIFDEYFSKWIC